MRIGELSKRTSLSRDTIRFYERKGLIRSSPNDSQTNSYKEYGDDAVLSLAVIREAQAAGFTISQLVEFQTQLAAAHQGSFDGEDFLQQKISEVELNIKRSKRFLKTLKQTKQALADAPKP